MEPAAARWTVQLSAPQARAVLRRRARGTLAANVILWVGIFGGLGAALGLLLTGALVGGLLFGGLGLVVAAGLTWVQRPAVQAAQLLAAERALGTGVSAPTELELAAGRLRLRRGGELLEVDHARVVLVERRGWVELWPGVHGPAWAWLPEQAPVLAALRQPAEPAAPRPPLTGAWGVDRSPLGPGKRAALRSAAGARPVRWSRVALMGAVGLTGTVLVLVVGGLFGLGLALLGFGLALVLALDPLLAALWARAGSRGPPLVHAFGPEGVFAQGAGQHTCTPWACVQQVEQRGDHLLIRGPRGWVAVAPEAEVDRAALLAAWRAAQPAVGAAPAPPEPRDPSPYRPPRQV